MAGTKLTEVDDDFALSDELIERMFITQVAAGNAAVCGLIALIDAAIGGMGSAFLWLLAGAVFAQFAGRTALAGTEKDNG